MSDTDKARQAILSSADRFWSWQNLGLPAPTGSRLLARLASAGELRRIRRGLYWRGGKTPLGMAPPPEDALVLALTGGGGVGLAGLSAANALRLSTQVPRFATYAVPGRALAPFGAVRFVSRAARTARVTADLTPIEVAVVEVLDAWERVIEIPEADAMARLEDLLANGAVRPESLAMAAATEPRRVRDRLAMMLEQSAASDGCRNWPRQ